MDLKALKGLGEKNELLLNKLGINSIEDLLEHYPYHYVEYKINDINEANDKDEVIIEGRIESIPIARFIKYNLNSLNFRVISNNKIITVTIYNRLFIKNNLTIGKVITIIGKYNLKKSTIVASNIILKRIEEGNIESKYHLTNGLTNKQMIKYINDALKLNIDLIDYVPDYLNEKYKFISKKSAIKIIHQPLILNDIKNAEIKLIYEELFKFMFKINYLKYINTKENNKIAKKCEIKDIQMFLNSLPFELTEDQKTAIKDIHKDLTSTNRMNRLICGDVGSGKTIIGVVAAYESIISGYQAALMAPTELLARQHYENIRFLLEEHNIKIALLLGSTKKKEKEKIYEQLTNGEIDFLIGTHALISEKVNFKNLGLVITDEQHRFGVNQRNLLRNKGELPDILYMTATPIPRTYALTIYGDMDISLIKTKPNGRKEIKTIIKNEKEIKDVLFMMLKEIKENHQIYVVTPLIEESENSEYKTVLELKEKLDIAFNKKISI